MTNHKRKPNYKSSRSCGLCKPWKRVGNSKKMTKIKLLKQMLNWREQDV